MVVNLKHIQLDMGQKGSPFIQLLSYKVMVKIVALIDGKPANDIVRICLFDSEWLSRQFTDTLIELDREMDLSWHDAKELASEFIHSWRV